MELILNSFFNFFFLSPVFCLILCTFYTHIPPDSSRALSETASILFFLYPRFILYRLRAVSCLFGVTWTLVAFLLRKNIFLILRHIFISKKKEKKNKRERKKEQEEKQMLFWFIRLFLPNCVLKINFFFNQRESIYNRKVETN